MNSLAMRLLHFCAFALTILPCKGNAALLTEDTTGSSTTMAVGGCIQIALRGNATTGFAWELAPGAEDILALEGEPEFTADSSGIGAGGVFTFTFRAVAPGEATLTLVYRRPWEKEMAPLKNYQLKVSVTPK
ncbi:protease inhibitor I42 family protein [Geomonas sp. RF6]|uniref:protease inhibitor I42 family protein n=1 Tax=Geomonas sp. RF6 TaxID=2897342 RepID=UPI001E607951|nr:protease inhibitor I42 family protein [Geomonas sp. RF6]UFS72214.1 protease inhibitor I42 family protein [Geomonas sp. RF6]